MADTKRTLAQLIAIFADNTTRDISAQDLRDFLLSAYGSREANTIAIDTTITTDYDIVLVNANSGQVNVTLPAASTNSLKTFLIKKIDTSSNLVKVTPAGSDTIDSESSFWMFVPQQCVEIVSDGTNWRIIAGGYKNGQIKIFEQTATATVPASVSNTTLLSTGIGGKTIPANWFTVGANLRIEAYGYATNAANTFDAQLHSALGSSIFDSVLVNNAAFWATQALVKTEVDFTCRSVGASGNFQVKSEFKVGTTLTVPGPSSSNLVVDTTVSNAIGLNLETVTSFFDTLGITNLKILASK